MRPAICFVGFLLNGAIQVVLKLFFVFALFIKVKRNGDNCGGHRYHCGYYR